MHRRKRKKEAVFAAEDLMQFEGWEVRRISTSNHKPGMIFQNPDTGEKRKLQFQSRAFDGGNMAVIRWKVTSLKL